MTAEMTAVIRLREEKIRELTRIFENIVSPTDAVVAATLAVQHDRQVVEILSRRVVDVDVTQPETIWQVAVQLARGAADRARAQHLEEL